MMDSRGSEGNEGYIVNAHKWHVALFEILKDCCYMPLLYIVDIPFG